MNRFFETRAQEQVLDGQQLDTALRAALGGSKVTVSTVLSIPAVSSVGFIAGTVASLPIRLYRTENGKSMEVTDDYRLRLLNEETGDLLDAFQWKCTLVRDYLLPGNRYTYVDWAENRIQGLYCVDPLQVSAEIGSDPIYKTARFTIRPVLAALQPTINCFYLLKKEKASCPLRSTWMR